MMTFGREFKPAFPGGEAGDSWRCCGGGGGRRTGANAEMKAPGGAKGNGEDGGAKAKTEGENDNGGRGRSRGAS